MQRTKWALGLVMMVLGLLLTMQFRVRHQGTDDASRLRADEISLELRASQEALRTSEAERQRLASELAETRAGDYATEAMERDMARLQLLAGTTEIDGPGVIVTLVESPEVSAGQTRVSDEDLWRVLNELLAAGAEAISINGRRITSVTAIRNVGQRIMIHQSMISTPVEVQAVGDAKVMEAALLMRGGIVEILNRWGIKVTVRRSETLHLPALQGALAFQYAKPAVKR